MKTNISDKDVAAWSPTFCQIVEQSVPGVFFFHVRGVVPAAAFEPTMRQVTATLARRHVTLVGDGLHWVNYESAYRPMWTDWLLEHRSNIDAVHLLVSSPFLRMGVQLVNLATNDLIATYSSREQLAKIVNTFWPYLSDVVDRLDARATALLKPTT